MDLSVIRKHYSGLTDRKLQELVENSVLDLTSDGLQVLKEEVAKRGLPLMQKIESTLKEEAELQSLIDKRCKYLREQPCPICGSNENKLNAVQLNTVIGVFTIEEQVHFGCPRCLRDLKILAGSNTSIWGWVLIHRIPYTLKALYENDKAITDLHKDEITVHLRGFAYKQLISERLKRKSTIVKVSITKQQELQ